jgi:hypothetical protein
VDLLAGDNRRVLVVGGVEDRAEVVEEQELVEFVVDEVLGRLAPDQFGQTLHLELALVALDGLLL